MHLPPGPLFRVEGTAISIPCSVSEYEGPTLQHFEWFLYRPTAPEISIGIVSTRDPAFPYAVFSPRVQSGEVSVQRLRGDAVELRVARLRAEDAGVYECYTPTTDSMYHGNYSSKVVLKGTWVLCSSGDSRAGGCPMHTAWLPVTPFQRWGQDREGGCKPPLSPTPPVPR